MDFCLSGECLCVLLTDGEDQSYQVKGRPPLMLLFRPWLEVEVMLKDELKAGVEEPHWRGTIYGVFPLS